MWIVLNPKKAHRFTTKGINLCKTTPTAFVDPSLDAEVKAVISKAINDGRVIAVQGDDLDGVGIHNQAKIETVSEEDTGKLAGVKSGLDEDGNRVNVIVMPGLDGKAASKVQKRGVIITDIEELPRDEDEDQGED